MDDPPIVLALLAALPDTELSWGEAWRSLLWVMALLGINGFFVAVEFSLVSARRSRMVQLASEGNRQADLVKRAQEHLERALSTTQLGITVSSVLLGWIGATQVSGVIRGVLALLPVFIDQDPETVGLQHGLLDGLAVILTFSLLTYLQIVWGELLPKTLAIVHAEPISLRLARLNDLVGRFLKPFVEVPRFSSRLILRLFGVQIPDPSSLYSTMTAEELQVLIASTVETGGIEEEERELLANVFEFGETVASEVMIPRTSVDAVPLTASVKDVLAEVAESDHSRYPVFGESLDDIRGVINIKELVAEMAKGTLQMDSGIMEFVRPAHFEHENKLIAELLPEMQQQHRAMVVVVDEFGGTAGLITIKDIVEEIVGTLSDNPEGEDDEPDIERVDDHTVIIQAQVNVEEANDQLDLDLPVHDDYQTLGGFLIYHLQKIPKVGDRFTYGTHELQVVRIEGPRLDRIKITSLSSGNGSMTSTEVSSARSSSYYKA